MIMSEGFLPSNDNSSRLSGVQRCEVIAYQLVSHPVPVARYLTATSMIYDIWLQGDEDGFHIAADHAELIMVQTDWPDADELLWSDGSTLGFVDSIYDEDGLSTAVGQAVLQPTVQAREVAVRGLMTFAAENPEGDWGWEIARFLNHARSSWPACRGAQVSSRDRFDALGMCVISPVPDAVGPSGHAE